MPTVSREAKFYLEEDFGRLLPMIKPIMIIPIRTMMIDIVPIELTVSFWAGGLLTVRPILRVAELVVLFIFFEQKSGSPTTK